MTTREEKSKDMQNEIESDQRRKQIKDVTILLFKITFIVIIIFTSFYLYTKFISTNGLIFKEKRIISEKIHDSLNSMKIIHFSDLHFGSTIDEDDLKKIVKDINVRNPDIIIFTGDLIDKDASLSDDKIESLKMELKKLKYGISMYATVGDEDDDTSIAILNECGFIILDNSSDLIYKNSNNPIMITGLSSIQKEQDINKAFINYQQNSNYYHIVAMHEADTFDNLSNYNIDLLLAGGSLNGQICLTSDICFIKKDGAEKYFKEYYKVGNTEMFISSGIGTGNPGFRIGARPSINFFRFSNSN